MHQNACLTHGVIEVLEEHLLGELHVADVAVVLVGLLEALERRPLGRVPDSNQMVGEAMEMILLRVALPVVDAGDISVLLTALNAIDFVLLTVDAAVLVDELSLGVVVALQPGEFCLINSVLHLSAHRIVLVVLGADLTLPLGQPGLFSGNVLRSSLGDCLGPVVRLHRGLQLLLRASVVNLKLSQPLLHLQVLVFLFPLDKLHLEFAGWRLSLHFLNDTRHFVSESEAPR